MPMNPIKEQRKIANKYIIGCYSKNNEFGEKLQSSLNSTDIQYELINLNDLDPEVLSLYLSILDEAIFDGKVPEDISETLKTMKLFIRVASITNIESLVGSIQERSQIILDLKKEKNFEREKDLKFIMQIVNILENKDPYTRDHSARVAKYSLAIGEEFFNNQYDELYGKNQGQPQYEEMKHDYVVQKLNLTMLAAWAHDIGKNSIAQSLLAKDSKLTDKEFDIMKMHADFGATMIRKILGDEEFAEIVENHHERIDGQGYHNLEEFSDISKIIAISDSFDAMTTARNYTTKSDDVKDKQKLLTIPEAINELQVSSHPHFDLEKNRMSQQLDTTLTQILVNMLKRELSLIQEGKTDEVTLLSGGLDEKGFLKAGFWNDKTQEYSRDASVWDSSPKFIK